MTAPADEDGRGTAEQIELAKQTGIEVSAQAETFTEQLADRGWTPRRAHIESARNYLSRAGQAICNLLATAALTASREGDGALETADNLLLAERWLAERTYPTPEQSRIAGLLLRLVRRALSRSPDGWRATAKPLSEWHEDIGPVLWWKFPINEPPYVGTPLDLPSTTKLKANGKFVADMTLPFTGWPGYHTHWTPIAVPEPPSKNEQ